MHKTEARMYFACPTRLTTMKLLRGGPINHFQNPFALTPDRSERITQPSSGSYSGMSYSVTFNSSSSTAPLLKRVLIASPGLSKTSEELLAAKCGKIIEVASLSDFSRFQWLTVPSEKTQR